jgi:hypothetical protein
MLAKISWIGAARRIVKTPVRQISPYVLHKSHTEIENVRGKCRI